MEKNLSRITLLRVVNKNLARVVHLTLVLLRMVMELGPALGKTVILVAIPTINLLGVILNLIQDLVRVKLLEDWLEA